jgi:hypothetical protein
LFVPDILSSSTTLLYSGSKTGGKEEDVTDGVIVGVGVLVLVTVGVGVGVMLVGVTVGVGVGNKTSSDNR